MEMAWAIWYVVCGLFVMVVFIYAVFAIQRRARHIYILVMDKATHAPLANHVVSGFFNEVFYQRQYMGQVAGQTQFAFTSESKQLGKPIGKTDANGFFKYCNRWRPMYAIGLKKGEKEILWMLDHFAVDGKGYPARPHVIWV